MDQTETDRREITAVRALLGAKPRPVGWAERRARIDEVGSVWPVAADVTLTPVAAGGVPAEWSIVPGSDPSRVLTFLHGGGYCSGSLVSHRRMVTEAGRAEVKDWLRELLGEPEREYSRFEAGLGDAGNLPPDEVMALLRRRLDVLDKANEETAAGLELLVQSQQVPRLFLVENEYYLAMRKAEAEWVRGLLAEFDDGTFPGLDFWRAMHASGGLDGSGNVPEIPAGIEVPAAIIEMLAKRGDTGKQS